MTTNEAIKELQTCLAELGRDYRNTTSTSAEARRHANSGLAHSLIRLLSKAKLQGQLSLGQAQTFADLENHYADIVLEVFTSEEQTREPNT